LSGRTRWTCRRQGTFVLDRNLEPVLTEPEAGAVREQHAEVLPEASAGGLLARGVQGGRATR
jgi:hypothetical protein